MKRYKGLVIGDAVSPTGFSRVVHSILRYLPEDKYDIHHLGINYFGDPHNYKHKIYPAGLGGDVFGIERVETLVKGIKPDFIFIVNDPWMIDMYLNKLRDLKKEFNFKIIVYFPIDAEEHSVSFYKNFDLVDKVCVYTDFAKSVLLQTNSKHIKASEIKIIPHGIDNSKFFPMDSKTARINLYPKTRTEEFLNSFIVFNGNRNQPRKRIDLTIWAFREFQKDKPDVKLYLHMGVVDMGINIAELSVRYKFDNKLILSTTDNRIPGVSDEQLNVIYNATDVGINTSLGEGWGLVPWEHASTGKPQILPYNSVNPEIWGQSAILVPTIMPQMIERVNTVGKVVSLSGVVEALNWAYNDWKYNSSKDLNVLGENGYKLTQQDKYKWENISKEFEKTFSEVL